MKTLPWFCLLFTLLQISLVASAKAQLGVTIRLDKSSFVSHEQVVAQISVENRAGKDIVLGGPSNTSWLQIDLRTSTGTIVGASNGEPKAETFVLKQGTTHTTKINLSKFYPIHEPGTYMVSCGVYFPELQRWLGSAGKSLIQVNSPKAAFWERTVGVPKSHPLYGRYRRYKLFTNKSNSITPTGNMELQLLYARIIDEETEENVATFPIGPILVYRDPQAATDSEGNLCVLYMAAPQVYQYLIMDVDGAIREQRVYKPTDSMPTLMQAKDGYVTVRGGRVYDALTENLKEQEQEKSVKSLGDRPKP
jgi:hypothetical protein